jgi:hypothetical protein
MGIKTRVKQHKGQLIIVLPDKYCDKIDVRRGDTVQVHINSLNSLRVVRLTEHTQQQGCENGQV